MTKPTSISGETEACIFCNKIMDDDVEDAYSDYVMFTPLNPVAEGHKLVVPIKHSANLQDNTNIGDLGWALRYFTNDLAQYNIITSKGSDATQTVQHLHFHIVPRNKDDGLMLPWTNQAKAKA